MKKIIVIVLSVLIYLPLESKEIENCKWKNESGDLILKQLKKLGCSCDWSRNRFTMDKDLSTAVIKTFVNLYNKKIIDCF